MERLCESKGLMEMCWTLLAILCGHSGQDCWEWRSWSQVGLPRAPNTHSFLVTDLHQRKGLTVAGPCCSVSALGAVSFPKGQDKSTDMQGDHCCSYNELEKSVLKIISIFFK